tara:strand:- start:4562 stop:9700 length:5139 start_codon:yes stop_codon:yes gene_type:complete
MPFDFDDRNPFAGFLTYPPLLVGIYKSIGRARSVIASDAAAVGASVASNQGFNSVAAAMPSFRMASPTTENVLLNRLRGSGLSSLELSPTNRHIIDKMSASPLALRAFLDHPSTGLSPQAVESAMGQLAGGTSVSEVLGGYANKNVFFQKLAEMRNIGDPSRLTRFGASIATGASPFTGGIAAPTVSPLQLTAGGNAAQLVQRLKGEFGDVIDPSSVRTSRVTLPGTFAMAQGKRAGEGYGQYLEFRLKAGGPTKRYKIATNTYIGSNSEPIRVFQHGKGFQTMYSAPRIHANPNSGQLMNLGEYLVFGEKNIDSPLVKNLQGVRDMVNAKSALASSSKVSRFLQSAGQYDEMVGMGIEGSGRGSGMWLRNLTTIGHQNEAILRSKMVKLGYFGRQGLSSQQAFQAFEGSIGSGFARSQNVIDQLGLKANAVEAGNPIALRASQKGLAYFGAPIAQGDFDQARRMLQPLFNPAYIDPAYIAQQGGAGARFGPGNVWKRFGSTMGGAGLMDEASTFFKYGTAFLLDESDQFHKVLGEGIFGVRAFATGRSMPASAARTYADLADVFEATQVSGGVDRVGRAAEVRMGKAFGFELSSLEELRASGVTPEDAGSFRGRQRSVLRDLLSRKRDELGSQAYGAMERKARAIATRSLELEMHPLIAGPDVILSSQYKVLAATDEGSAIVSSAMNRLKGGSTLALQPGDFLGTIDDPIAGISPVEATGKYFGQETITGVESKGKYNILHTQIKAPMQEYMGFHGGGKLRAAAFSNWKAIVDVLGIDQALGAQMEAIAGPGAELFKNPIYLREQQISGLAAMTKATQQQADSIFTYRNMVARGGALNAGKGLSKHNQALLGMLHTAKGAGLSSREMALVFGAERKWASKGSLLYDQPGVARSVLGAGSYQKMMGAFDPGAAHWGGKSPFVVGTMSLSPTRVLGQQTGGMARIEPRALMALSQSLPENLSSVVIPDIMGRLSSTEHAMATQWMGSPKKFAGMAASSEIPLSPFHPTERRHYKLPTDLGFKGRFANIALPSLAELERMQPPSDFPGAFGTSYRKTVEDLFTELRKVPSSANIGTARMLVERAFQEQTYIYSQTVQGHTRGKLPGSVTAHVARHSALSPVGKAVQTSANTLNIPISETAFETMTGQLRRAGSSPEHLSSMRASFQSGGRIPGMIIRNPAIPEHSAQITTFSKMASDVGGLGPRSGQAVAYIPESRAFVGKNSYGASVWLAMSANADWDGDTATLALPGDPRAAKQMQNYVAKNRIVKNVAAKYRQEMVQNAVIMQRMKGAWKGTAGAVGAASPFVSGAVSLAGQGSVGRLTNAMSMLMEANLQTQSTETLGTGIVSSRRSMGHLLYSMQEAAISTKHLAGQSPADEISGEISRILRTGPGERNVGGRALTMGEELAKYMFGQGEGKGIAQSKFGLGGFVGGQVDIPMELEMAGGGRHSMPMQVGVSRDYVRHWAATVDRLAESDFQTFQKIRDLKPGAAQRLTLGQISDYTQTMKGQPSPVYTDIIADLHRSYLGGKGAEHVASMNKATKIGSVLKTMSRKWQHISNPLLIGGMIAGGMHMALGGPGYAKEPLSMSGEEIDPRILAAIRSGGLTRGSGGQTMMGTMAAGNNAQFNSARIANRSMPTDANEQHYPGYNMRNIYSPSARVVMPNTASYNIEASANTNAAARNMAAHFQANIPHARVGLTIRDNTRMLTNRFEDQL